MAKLSLSDECLDMDTPWNEYLSAKYKRSFAYHTVLNRLPVTVTQVIDHLSRRKEDIAQSCGEGSREEIKEVIGYLSRLKNEMQTNKPLTLFTAKEKDLDLWNNFLLKSKEAGRPLLWFADVWLHIECYLYRRIREGFALTKHLQEYDPFRQQKEDAFSGSLQAISIVGDHLLKLCNSNGPVDKEKSLLQFLKLSLWGNRCDLSISGGKDVAQVEDPLEKLSELDELILVNDLSRVLEVMNSASAGSRTIDVIFDNAGYELFTDLCLAYFLVKFNFANTVRFHGKSIPWFISDVMEHDFHWILQEMAVVTSKPCLPELSRKWRECLDSGKWSLHIEPFWTLPYSYDSMKNVDLELYKSFQQSKLLIFKGDLNYRKLVGDMHWVPTENFAVALRGFQPAPLVTLRTLKADVVVGLREGQADEVANVDADWQLTGKYAVVSCAC